MLEDSLILLINEFESLEENPMVDIGCQVWLKNDYNYYEWEGMMQGPKDSPYKGAFLYFTISFGHNYPYARPEFRFSFKNMYHLNIDQNNGHVCINVLNEWNAEKKIKIRDIIHSVYQILIKQNPDSAYGYQFTDDRIKLYRDNREKFNENAKLWVKNNALHTRK